MQATYDAFMMVKMAFDTGCDLTGAPIDFYCYEWGSQNSVFHDCINRIFGECQIADIGMNNNGQEITSIKIPLPQLNELFTIITAEEKDAYKESFRNRLINKSEEFEMEMEGYVSEQFIHVTLAGSYDYHYSFLKRLVEIRSEVLERLKREKQFLLQRLHNVVMIKMVHDRLGSSFDLSIDEDSNVVFKQLMSKLNHEAVASDILSNEEMLAILQKSLSQVENNKSREDEAA